MGRWRGERALIQMLAGQPCTLAAQRHRNVRVVLRQACAVALSVGQPPKPWAATSPDVGERCGEVLRCVAAVPQPWMWNGLPARST
jgi:hypothetical protein